MKGLEISEKYFNEVGLPMLKEQFPQVLPLIAAGLCGSGSECYGYDDEVSRDHDFEPGFLIFLPDESVVDSRTEFALKRAYAALPGQFMGLTRGEVSPVGGGRHGVIRFSEYLTNKIGNGDGAISTEAWLNIPEYALAEAVNGKIFYDGSGEVSGIRQKLSKYPTDIKLKKLAGHLLLMHQAGAYNYSRCLDHGEEAAAQLAIYEYVTSAMHVIFLLNDTYMPYYKWSFRAMRSLPILGELADSLDYLMTSGNSQGQRKVKEGVIEDIRLRVTAAALEGGIISSKSRTPGVGLSSGTFAAASSGIGLDREAVLSGVSAYDSLHQLAYAVQDSIKDGSLRNLNILAGV